MATDSSVIEAALADWRTALDAANDAYCSAVANANMDAGGCPCGSGCCGDPECCGNCYSDIDPPMTYDKFLSMRDELDEMKRKVSAMREGLAISQQGLASTQEFLRVANQENSYLRRQLVPTRPADFGME